MKSRTRYGVDISSQSTEPEKKVVSIVKEEKKPEENKKDTSVVQKKAETKTNDKK